MPDHPRTLSYPLPDIDQLDLVGIHHIDIRIPIRQRGRRLPDYAPPQPGRQQAHHGPARAARVPSPKPLRQTSGAGDALLCGQQGNIQPRRPLTGSLALHMAAAGIPLSGTGGCAATPLV